MKQRSASLFFSTKITVFSIPKFWRQYEYQQRNAPIGNLVQLVILAFAFHFIFTTFDLYDYYKIPYYFDQAKVHLIPFYNEKLVPLYNNQVVPLYNDQIIPLCNQVKDALIQLTK